MTVIRLTFCICASPASQLRIQIRILPNNRTIMMPSMLVAISTSRSVKPATLQLAPCTAAFRITAQPSSRGTRRSVVNVKERSAVPDGQMTVTSIR